MIVRGASRWLLRRATVALLCILAVVVLGPTGAGAQQPERVEKLTIATEADKGNLTPYSFRPPPGVHSEMVGLIYDTLFLHPYTEEPIPWLATEASANADATTWTVKLRDDVTWHDGEEFTAEDVAFTYDYYRDGPPNRYTHHASDVPVVESAEALDATTVEFTCERPCPTLDLVTLADLPILPRHIWEDVEDPQTYTELPVGTGPYKLAEYMEDRSYRFEANEDYFLGPPAVREIEMPIVPDPQSTFLALQNGQVQTATRPAPPELQERIGGARDVETVEGKRFSSIFFRFNAERPPLDQPEFRRALDMAINRQALVDTVLLGRGRPGSPSFMHPDSRWFEPQEAAFDPEQAGAVLDETGITDSDGDGTREYEGEPVSLSVIVPANDPLQIRTAEIVAQQLREVGIELRPESLDPGTLSQRQNALDFELASFQGVPHLLGDPTQMIESLASLLFYSNPEYEGLREEWFEAPTVEQQDETLREIQRLFAEDPPAFTLYYPDTTYAYNSSAYSGWIPVEGHGIFNKWSFIPEASERLRVETVAQRSAPAPAEEPGGRTTLYVLLGAGAVVLLAFAVFLLRRRSARGSNEDRI
ncbi:MAG: ABC transporter substrate-binding protein [Actinobacteria bacterium]|nr:ABC transporter substrate-binding protein [Actinomycetota bacterium]PLS87721.1 MAG: ABC transporter substrate-binding protein [Actinomycetota bacterium]